MISTPGNLAAALPDYSAKSVSPRPLTPLRGQIFTIHEAAGASHVTRVSSRVLGLALWARSLFAPAMFWVKKSVSFWLMPLPVCLTLLVLGVILLGCTQRKRLGRALVMAGTGLLLLFSNKTVSAWLVRPLEARFPVIPELSEKHPPPPELTACRFLVVLGGGHSNTPELPAMSQLSPSARARLVEGVRLLRFLSETQLIVSGAGIRNHPSHAAVLARAAESLGVERHRIRLLDTPRDTEDEAAAVRQLVGPATVALVTSAWHMPRAEALFRQAGVTALPCPADFSARPNLDFHWYDLTWDTASLERSTWAVRERIGYLWAWLRRKVP